MSISRRVVLKSSAAASTLLAAPAVLRGPAFGQSSGTVNVFAWGDYIQQNMIDAFEGETGIKVNLSTYGSNDEATQKLKASGGKGFDVIFPSITNVANYVDNGDLLLQEIDESRANVSAIIPSMYRDSIQLGGVQLGKRVAIPFDWGTEAITFDSSAMDLADADVSYGSLWAPEATGAAAFRQKSVLMGTGLYLTANGDLESNRMYDAYKTEEDMRRIFEAVTTFIIDHKANFGAFWNNATEATNAFQQAGCTIGQTWDTTGILLNRDDAKYKYRMPKEGGLTWMDSMGIPAGAENVDQAYAFINALLTPKMGGMFASNTGYNSCVDGAALYAGEEYAKQFNEIYNTENLANLWWWQSDTPFFAAGVQEYVDRITNAA
ncbi:spermidine/putrescine ABC transporter substrate-binding protein [Acuticoccus sediminis]|uniref:Spermidine/putrescine ABC transporter substrate-binding protein n=1 Tax=Acuticoccus sediminis TaxID=2184697 RepID=A0A8B2NNN7_9HYPH|nr:extracellular solute-binding protein [Acuticoccus sediminis]RAH99487.1 spermidine/putrescine ABC transporter substrate-binding protein [Acuticoccus sediminis]